MSVTLIDLGKPAAATVGAVHAAFAASTPSPFPPTAQPDKPRTLNVTGAAGWDGGDVIVDGIDQRGNTTEEQFKAADITGATKLGVKVFAVVQRIRHTLIGGAATASVDTGISLGYKPVAFGPAIASIFDGGLGVGAEFPAALDTANGSYTPVAANVPNGTHRYALTIDR